MSIEQESFKKALSRWATGITVISTCTPQGKPIGFTASSFTSLSLAPPMVLFCIATSSNRLQAFNEASVFGVSILAENQSGVSNHFASREENLFENTPHELGQLGVPLLHGALTRLECRITQRVPGGDHQIILGEVETAQLEEGSPLIYFHGAYHQLQQS